MVHLQADLRATVAWAAENGVRWAFTNCNAGATYAEFFCSLDQLGRVNWEAVAARDFRDGRIKEGKQAEFLVYDFFPWKLVDRIGLLDRQIANQVNEIIVPSSHQPVVSIEREWYY